MMRGWSVRRGTVPALGVLAFWFTGCTSFVMLPDEVGKIRDQLSAHVQDEKDFHDKVLGGASGQSGTAEVAASIAELRGRTDQLQEQIQALSSQMEDLIALMGDVSKQVNKGMQSRPLPQVAPQQHQPPVMREQPSEAPFPPGSLPPSTPPQAASGPPGPAPSPASQQDAAGLYNEAYRVFTREDYDGAIPLFQALVDKYPSDFLADNAQFWIGECHLAKKRVGEAEKAFQDVVVRFPNGNKVPDALFKLGLCQKMQNKAEAALATWNDLIARYGNEPASMKAKQEIQSMGR